MDILLSAVTSFLVAFSAVPIIIRIARSIDIMDAPDLRKVHVESTPALGGIAIFLGFIVTISFWVPLVELAQYKFLLLPIFFSFLLGVRDDIASLQALDKLTIQVFAALLVVFIADIRFSGLYGLLGLTELPTGVAEFLSIFVIVGLTNAFNLIDGIDGLAGSVAVIILSFFGWWFFDTGYTTLGYFSMTMGAATLAFLFFNWSPAKIFMGDTGSLVLGFTLSSLMIQFIDLNYLLPTESPLFLQSPIALSFALLVLPVYDTLRVFIIRFMAGRSPMSPDQNHVHHILLKLNFSHSQATLTLVTFNLLMVGVAYSLQFLGNNWLSLIILVLAIAFGATLDFILKKRTASAGSHKNATLA
jgi:UDP-N-acetylmuramyl pentapeptide phosphotransferase/UDP-N-acetylglucosamine-1-phosphate transferase